MSHPSPAWQAVFTAVGLPVDEAGQPARASEPTPRSLHALTDIGVIAVSGEDRVAFLQGQLTNDVKQLSAAGQFTGYCTPKGRLLAIFYAVQSQEVIYLLCDRGLLPDLIKRLRMYVLRSKVVIEEASEQRLVFGLAQAANTDDHTWPLPTAPHQVQDAATGIQIGLPAAAGQLRALMLVPATQATAVWQQYQQTFSVSDCGHWEALEIQAGIPHIVAATREQFVPQMVNLDALHGINFKKGCYTGQEIVARTHYLGKVKRRTLLAQLPATAVPPQAGDVLYDQQQQEAGQLVRVAPAAAGGWWLLAECRLEAHAAGDIVWQQQPLRFLTMPYALEA